MYNYIRTVELLVIVSLVYIENRRLSLCSPNTNCGKQLYIIVFILYINNDRMQSLVYLPPPHCDELLRNNEKVCCLDLPLNGFIVHFRTEIYVHDIQ